MLALNLNTPRTEKQKTLNNPNGSPVQGMEAATNNNRERHDEKQRRGKILAL
jgi:hypothetical protein